MEKKQYTAPAVRIHIVDLTNFLELSYHGEGDGTDIAAPRRPEDYSSDYSW